MESETIPMLKLPLNLYEKTDGETINAPAPATTVQIAQ